MFFHLPNGHIQRKHVHSKVITLELWIFLVTISYWKTLKKTESWILGCRIFSQKTAEKWRPFIFYQTQTSKRVDPMIPSESLGKNNLLKLHVLSQFIPMNIFPSPNFAFVVFLELGTSTSPSLGWTRRAARFMGGFFGWRKKTDHHVISEVAVFLGYIITSLFFRFMVVAMLSLCHPISCFTVLKRRIKLQTTKKHDLFSFFANATMDAIELS